jgi:hypothetical protein
LAADYVLDLILVFLICKQILPADAFANKSCPLMQPKQQKICDYFGDLPIVG